MKKIIAAITCLAFLPGLMAQNANDALRYSMIQYGGTARFMGMSGAYGAVGADFSSLSQNPAGLGLYHKSEITFTPGFTSGSTNADYYGTLTNDNRTNAAIYNAGGVLVMNTSGNNTSGLKAFQFGFGLNRSNDFNNRSTVTGFNNESSLMTAYRTQAYNVAPDNLNQFGTDLAYQTYLMDLDTTFYRTNGIYRYLIDMPDGHVWQSKMTETKGSRSEFSIGASMNFNDMLYIGGSIGIPSINYEETGIYTEKRDPADNNTAYFNSLTLRNYLNTTGSGINFKFGVIVRPAPFIRLGAAIHSPTYYNRLHDTWSSSMTSDLLGAYQIHSGTYDSPIGDYNYSLTTPMRVMGSIAFIAGKNGLISADYEYIDFTKAKLKASDYNFAAENSDIASNFRATSNFRLGGEYNFGMMSLRAGYHLYGSPYKNSTTGSSTNNNKDVVSGFSLGVGVHDKNWFLDFSYLHSGQQQDVFLYDPSLATTQASLNKIKLDQLAATIGFRF